MLTVNKRQLFDLLDVLLGELKQHLVTEPSREYLRLQQQLVVLLLIRLLVHLLDPHQGVRVATHQPRARSKDLVEESGQVQDLRTERRRDLQFKAVAFRDWVPD